MLQCRATILSFSYCRLIVKGGLLSVEDIAFHPEEEDVGADPTQSARPGGSSLHPLREKVCFRRLPYHRIAVDGVCEGPVATLSQRRAGGLPGEGLAREGHQRAERLQIGDGGEPGGCGADGILIY